MTLSNNEVYKRRNDTKRWIVLIVIAVPSTVLLITSLSQLADIPSGQIFQHLQVLKVIVASGAGVVISLLTFISQVRSNMAGLPELTISESRVMYETISGQNWASWDSLDEFKIIYVGSSRRKQVFIQAKITGPNISEDLKKKNVFSFYPKTFVPDPYQLLEALNKKRAQALKKEYVPNEGARTPPEWKPGFSYISHVWVMWFAIFVFTGFGVLILAPSHYFSIQQIYMPAAILAAYMVWRKYLRKK